MPSTNTQDLPLSNLTVIELGNIVAAPFASLVLADLGANVIKVERPGVGDQMRNSEGSGDAIFLTLNRNKRSLVLDLKTEPGRKAYRQLAIEADVVVENLGPGVVERLGIGYESLCEVNPGIVYLSIKGFFDGPKGDRAGIDMVGEAMSGLMSMTGEPGRKPVRVGTSIADIGAALYGLMGVFLSLWQRERTGEGQKVTGSLFESASHLMGYWMTYAQLFDRNHPSLGSTHPTFCLYDVFETHEENAWLFVGVATPRHWPAFCRATNMEYLLSDERFDTPEKRLEHKDELTDIVHKQLRKRNRETLLESLLAESVPAAPVNNPSDLIDDPHLRETGLLTEFTAKYEGETQDLQALLSPLRGTNIATGHYRSPPALGEHSRSILSELGYDNNEINALFDAGVSEPETGGEQA
jgi:crotonobetainyl-CoA:carnitine CoA-transferase CaiB-like acyl-CoA transferase